MLRMREVALAREWRRIERLVDRRISDKYTSEATMTMLDALEKNLEVGSDVEMFPENLE